MCFPSLLVKLSQNPSSGQYFPLFLLSLLSVYHKSMSLSYTYCGWIWLNLKTVLVNTQGMYTSSYVAEFNPALQSCFSFSYRRGERMLWGLSCALNMNVCNGGPMALLFLSKNLSNIATLLDSVEKGFKIVAYLIIICWDNILRKQWKKL